MRPHATALAALLAAFALGGPSPASPPDGARFPHAPHERLFPTCLTCHGGIESGEEAAVYPAAGSCLRCHDGERRERLEWAGPRPRASNLTFSHVRHGRRVAEAGAEAGCSTCHGNPGSGSIEAAAPSPARCLSCHAHAAPGHLDAQARCTRCHRPLADAPELGPERVRSLPRPPSHEAASFLSGHGTEAGIGSSCAVCHARESCERCHANAEALPAVRALPRDARIATLVRGRAPEYATPTDHRGDWAWRHSGAAAARPEACANCHARPSCRACHRDGALASLAALPEPAPGRAPGVTVQPDRRIHPASFRTGHRAQAGAGGACESCHARRFCETCHDAAATPSFHGANFLEMHAPRAYANEGECASCHSPELFCRECHRATGRATRGRQDAVFHDAQALWLLGHGRPARQGLQGCASCHAQSDCLRCHSANGGWRIDPHGPGFDPDRAARANRIACLSCHRSRELPP